MAENTAPAPVPVAPAAATTPAPAAAPAAAEPAKASAPAALTSKLVSDPDKFLADFRAARGFKPRPAKEATTHAKPAEQAAGAQPAPTTATTEPVAKPGEQPDELAARLAKFTREELAFKQRQREFEEAQKRAKEEREAAEKTNAERLARAELVDKASAALEKGDALGLIRLLKNDANPSAFALQLLEQLNAEDTRTMSPAEVEAMIAANLAKEAERQKREAEEDRKAEEEKQKQTAQTRLESARDSYMQSCLDAFSKKSGEFHFVAARGVTREQVVAYAEGQLDENGRPAVPDPEEVLKHFEAKYRAEAERAGWAPRPTEAPKPAPSPSLSPSSLVADSGGTVAPEKRDSPRNRLERKREEVRNKLRLLGQQQAR